MCKARLDELDSGCPGAPGLPWGQMYRTEKVVKRGRHVPQWALALARKLPQNPARSPIEVPQLRDGFGIERLPKVLHEAPCVSSCKTIWLRTHMATEGVTLRPRRPVPVPSGGRELRAAGSCLDVTPRVISKT